MNATTPLDPADELAIRNLLARYGDAVCRRDAAAWIATWAAECTWDLGGGRITHGRDETFALWQKSIAKYPWVAQLPASGTGRVGRWSGAWKLVRPGTEPSARWFRRDASRPLRRHVRSRRGRVALRCPPLPPRLPGRDGPRDGEPATGRVIVADKDYEDVTVYGLGDAAEAELLGSQTECTFIWSNSEGPSPRSDHELPSSATAGSG